MMFEFSPDEHKRSQNYSRYLFTDGGMAGGQWFNLGLLRDDEYSAAAYTFGAAAYPEDVQEDKLAAVDAFGNFDSQVEALSRYNSRAANHVLDIGCGRGMLAAAIINLGARVTAIDFSQHAVQLTAETVTRRSNPERLSVLRFGLEHLAEFPFTDPPDTVVFCESIEHIRQEDFETGFEVFRQWNPLLVIVNLIGWHPIYKDNTGWNHIRTIDNAVYDEIASHGKTIYRQGSHLVIQL